MSEQKHTEDEFTWIPNQTHYLTKKKRPNGPQGIQEISQKFQGATNIFLTYTSFLLFDTNDVLHRLGDKLITIYFSEKLRLNIFVLKYIGVALYSYVSY